MQIVVITQNQASELEQTLQSIADHKPFVVCDRCKDNSIEIASKYGFAIDTTPLDIHGRCTSTARNIGLSYTADDALFLDGDRAVIGDLSSIEQTDKDIVLLKLQQDNRPTDANELYGNYYNGFYSCGVFFRRSAINKVIDRYGELFPTWIEHVWGLEDITLGDICYDLGLSVEYAKNVLLKGKFERTELDNINDLLLRLQFRKTLKTKDL